ncbi:hypothetical protein [Streptomyces sp. WAC01280]|uniref:hypothetical protein n=1 Tax=Streptomyces sp. WAC01280 TaxID=2487424 RepID=UPI000F78AB4C|nr:hypothetical protein [Streptomyces sp. WAC01280]RSS55289.1 hypothetical protein EF909_19130 [Streptomyces sp. WAC01280]
MISEPELDGGDGFVTSEVLTETPPPGPPRTRRPWLWALGGAVLASAVWGGGLYAYEKPQPSGPDLGGYKAVEDLCAVAEFNALAGVLGEPSKDGMTGGMDDPAVHETSCPVIFGPPETGFSVSLRYTLHKVSDPGPEFEARAKYVDLSTPIDGIGEKAFFDGRGGEGGEMRVLDGQVEIELSIYRQYETDEQGNPLGEPKPVDLSGIEVPMTQDLLALMAALKK